MSLNIRSVIPESLQAADMTTFIDLFCGIGGFHYAAQDMGLNCVLACDIDAHCRAQYAHNFGINPVADIKTLKTDNVPDHDLLFAGFPCQPFSIIGEMKGLEDDRGTLFHEVLRIIKAKRPKAVVLENVRQFANINKGKALSDVLTGLGKLGYSCHWRILNALDFGLPQKRDRILIIGFKDELSSELFQWPIPRTKYTPLAEILEKNPDKRHSVSPQIRAKRKAAHKPDVTPSIWHENKSANISSHPYSCALRANASHNYLLVNGARRLTPREMLRLQGFPESFEILGGDSQIKKQTGNAVPVPMVRAVIREVLHAESQNTRWNNEARALSFG